MNIKRIALFIFTMSLTNSTINAITAAITTTGTRRGLSVIQVEAASGGHVTIQNISPILLYLWAQDQKNGEWGVPASDFNGYPLAPGATVKVKVNDNKWHISAWTQPGAANRPDWYGDYQVSADGRLQVIEATACVCGSCYGESPLGTAAWCL